MHDFAYARGKLHCEGVLLETLARNHGTPLFVYSHRTLTENWLSLDRALQPLDHLICYAVKANSNLAVLRSVADLGSGFDIVSEGELRRVMEAGGDPRKCAFAGVGKTEAEIEFALRQEIYVFNVESEAELTRIHQVAKRLRRVAPIAIRLNPNIDAKTHAKITTGTYENKFGIAFEAVERIYRAASKLPHLRPRGLQMHIGSQLTEVQPYLDAVRKVAPLAGRLIKRYDLEFLSIGGGLGIIYEEALESGSPAWWKRPAARKLLTPASYAESLVPLLKPLGVRVLIEPGRFICGNAGALITRVEYIKKTGKKNFVIVDAAMNDLIRPAFYDSHHQIVPLNVKRGAARPSDVVGPICESGDYFCKDRPLAPVGEGDYLALMSAGAYGFVMASNYNTRPLAAEIMVQGKKSAVVRRRQSFDDLWNLEAVPPWLGSSLLTKKVVNN